VALTAAFTVICLTPLTGINISITSAIVEQRNPMWDTLMPLKSSPNSGQVLVFKYGIQVPAAFRFKSLLQGLYHILVQATCKELPVCHQGSSCKTNFQSYQLPLIILVINLCYGVSSPHKTPHWRSTLEQ